jgi:hypothetical protein
MSPNPSSLLPGGAATPAPSGEAPAMSVDALPPEPANQR